jgi:cytidylate kinase
MKKYFDRDIDDPLLYDLVINTNHLRPADTARLIVEASKIKATSVDARR